MSSKGRGNDAYGEVPNRLRELRLSTNKGVVKAAGEMGFDPAMVLRHEKGRRAMTMDTASRYRTYYNVDTYLELFINPDTGNTGDMGFDK